MKSFIYFIISVFSIYVLVGCHSQVGHEYDAVTVNVAVHLDRPSPEKIIRLSDYVNDVQFIPISCDGTLCPMGPLARYCRGFYYIIDRDTQCIIKINEEGKVVSRIGSQGRALNEYISITSFDVNPSTSEVFVYESERNKMVVYSAEGEYVRSFCLDETMGMFRDFAVFPNGNIIGCNMLDNEPPLLSGVWMVDSYGRFLKQIVTIDKRTRFLIGLSLPLFSRIGEDTVSIMGPVGDDSVYYIDSNGTVIRRYVFDFGSQIKSRDLRKEARTPLPSYFFNKGAFAASSESFFEIYGNKGGKVYMIFYDVNDDICHVESSGTEIMIFDVPNYIGGSITDGSRYLNFCDTNSLPPDVPVTDSTALWMVVTHLKNN